MQPARNLPGRLSQSPGAIDWGNDRHTGQNSGRIHLEQGFEGTRLNTGTMADLQTLVRHLLANFRTIRLPAEALPVTPQSPAFRLVGDGQSSPCREAGAL